MNFAVGSLMLGCRSPEDKILLRILLLSGVETDLALRFVHEDFFLM